MSDVTNNATAIASNRYFAYDSMNRQWVIDATAPVVNNTVATSNLQNNSLDTVGELLHRSLGRRRAVVGGERDLQVTHLEQRSHAQYLTLGSRNA